MQGATASRRYQGRPMSVLIVWLCKSTSRPSDVNCGALSREHFQIWPHTYGTVPTPATSKPPPSLMSTLPHLLSLRHPERKMALVQVLQLQGRCWPSARCQDRGILTPCNSRQATNSRHPTSQVVRLLMPAPQILQARHLIPSHPLTTAQIILYHKPKYRQYQRQKLVAR